MTIVQFVQDFLTIVGALGSMATLLSHLPLIPAKSQEWLARFGMTTSRFAVEKKPGTP